MHVKLSTSVSSHFDGLSIYYRSQPGNMMLCFTNPYLFFVQPYHLGFNALKLLTWHRRVGGLGGDGLSSISRYRCSDGDGGEVVDGVWGVERLLIMKIGSLIKGI